MRLQADDDDDEDAEKKAKDTDTDDEDDDFKGDPLAGTAIQVVKDHRSYWEKLVESLRHAPVIEVGRREEYCRYAVLGQVADFSRSAGRISWRLGVCCQKLKRASRPRRRQLL